MQTDNKARILFIEDDVSGREVGVFNLSKAGYHVDGAPDGKTGLKLFEEEDYDLVVTDVKMPGISGMDVLKNIRKQTVDVPVLVITAFADVDMAVTAMRAGAHDFIGKPFNRDHLLLTIEKALATRKMGQELKQLRIQATGIERAIIAGSDEMKRVLDVTDKVAASDATVLVTGESGTGKELIARRIHVKSQRAERSFVALNAAAMPRELLESELFGHIKGAFTGATNSRAGRFKQANGGTLFLDEIAEMPLELQSKLLRALQEKTVDAVGSDTSENVDTRVIAATNRDLAGEVSSNNFRADLFYRLNVLAIHVPPLRERKGDILSLAKYFLTQYGNGREMAMSSPVRKRLCDYHWPGNVRELENVCQRMAIFSTGTEVQEADLPFGTNALARAEGHSDPFQNWPPLPEEGLSLIDLEKRVIERVLEIKDGNVSKAATYLGVPRHVLAYRMQKYGMSK